jgi:hypothetical protein
MTDLAIEKKEQPELQASPMNLLAIALQNNAAIDVIERLSALQERAILRQAELEFNDAMSFCQRQLKMVVNDADGPKKKFASYKALDKEVRPTYIDHGFSLSFGSKECSIPDHIIVTCLVSKGMYTRPYELLMECSGKGPKGEGALSRPHAILAAMEYGRRCLLKSIFNLVTGDEEAIQTNGELIEACEWIENACDPDELKRLYKDAYTKWETSPDALKIIIASRKKRKEEMGW